MKLKKTIFILILFLTLILTATPLLADEPSSLNAAGGRFKAFAEAAGIQSKIGESPSIMIANIIKVILSFLGVIFMVLIIYGGYMWMASAGNEERVGKAKKIIVAAVIGVAVVIMAYTITYFITYWLIESTGAPIPDL